MEEELEALVEQEELVAMQQELKLRIQAEEEELERLKVQDLWFFIVRMCDIAVVHVPQ